MVVFQEKGGGKATCKPPPQHAANQTKRSHNDV